VNKGGGGASLAHGEWALGSLAVAEEGEENEAELVRGSTEHKRQWRGSTMVVEDGGSSSAV
jgi:hypothetical protein